MNQNGCSINSQVGWPNLVDHYNDVVGEKEAWHTVVWFAVLMTLAGQLNKMGLIAWLGQLAGNAVSGFHWLPMLGILLLVYYYSHYLMASAIAHISAMYAIFVALLNNLTV